MTGSAKARTYRGPWPGPVPYDEKDRRLLHGRDQDREEVLKRLQALRFLLVTAYSGVGKTSFLRASVVPELRQRRADYLAGHEAEPQPAVLVGLGLGAGLGVALGTTRSLAPQLWGVAPVDPQTFVGASGGLAVCGWRRDPGGGADPEEPRISRSTRIQSVCVIRVFVTSVLLPGLRRALNK